MDDRREEAAEAILDFLEKSLTLRVSEPIDVRVTARNDLGDIDTAYRGTIHFGSTDAGAVLPADYTFTAGDNGRRMFTDGASLATPGSQTISAADTAAGTGDTALCTAPVTRAQIDLCEWSQALQGSAETQGSTLVGGMIGARGCVEQIQAANAATGICQPAIYRVTIAWQGFNSTVVPAVNCGAGQYGSDDTLRKAISLQVVTPLPNCS